LPARVVCFGATGYTGRLVASALVAAGVETIVAGRDAGRLSALARELGDLEHVQADARDTSWLRRVLRRGDVLLSTVGPFAVHGDGAIEAALEAGAHYLDCCGEPAFIRRVFAHYDPRARRADVALLPAIGSDFVPGNLAAALALEATEEPGSAVQVGYFMLGAGSLRQALSSGTLASLAEALLAPGFTFRDGRVSDEAGGRRSRAFEVDGRERWGISIGSTEALSLPHRYPSLREVDVYLGWLGDRSRHVPRLAAAGALAQRVPVLAPAQRRLARSLASASASAGVAGPDAARRAAVVTHVVAEALSPRRNVVARVALRGLNPYDYTAGILAWVASRLAADGVAVRGAAGPAEAFSVQDLVQGNAEAGMHVVS
jgi:short subunit dehydrogenase-like uncharacterized protein